MVRVARDLAREKKYGKVVCAYLEITHPSILEAVDACAAEGAREIRLVPYFLLIGRHVTADIPNIAAEAAKKYSGRCRIRLAPYLGYHPNITAVVKEKIALAK